ncbi:hypothetical protein SJI00_07180 [Pseudomonas sp. RP23018S]|uniref:hypothetical protein n=1 Tax=Pseudomonas sp. RP23018S TaxID=3096037 RepID=UPI002ACA138B|nr:hypothetical protein [Pseudomonas sp. RP23018S]MDZ5602552.1 hypothetical protein [Pseudomonas sp. RP23018S]
MTTAELVRLLRGVPAHAEVFTATHDQGEFEYDGTPYSADFHQAHSDFHRENPDLDPAVPVIILR